MKKNSEIQYGQYISLSKSIVKEVLLDRKIQFCFSVFSILLILGVLVRVYSPILFKNVVELLISYDQQEAILSSILIYAFVLGMLYILVPIQEICVRGFQERIITVITERIISRLYKLSYSSYLNYRVGILANLIRKVQKNIPSIILNLFFYIVPLTLEVLIVFVILVNTFSSMYLIIFMSSLAMLIVFTFYTTKYALKMRYKTDVIDNNSDAEVTNLLQNFEMVRIFGLTEYVLQLSKHILRDREQSQVKSLLILSFIFLGQAIILSGSFFILMFFLGKAVAQQEITPGNFTLFYGYLIQFTTPASVLGFVMGDFKKALADIRSSIGILLLNNEPKIQPVATTNNKKELYKIEFRKVSFCYNNTNILDDVSFEIYPNQLTALVGKTGEGKSTILKLLLRLYNVNSGEILINNVNINAFSLDDLYNIIGLVPQEFQSFDGTIKKNIQIANLDADSNQINKAISLSYLTNFINKLPQGLETQIGDHGVRLSAGEKQRISLARIFLKEPKIYLLDEPTSNLDKNTSLLVYKSLKTTLSKATGLIITHKLEELESFQKILLLKNKKVYTVKT